MTPNVYEVDGKKLELYPIGVLAYELGRQAQTIYKWERKGIIPPSSFRSPSGRRLYTKGQIKAITKTARKYKLRQGSEIPSEFIEAVWKAFSEATQEDTAS